MMQYHQRASRSPHSRKKPVYASAEPDEQEPASPHRAGHYAGLHPEDTPYTTTADVMQRLSPQQTQLEEDYADDEAPARIKGIVPRYNRIPTADGYIERRGNQQMHVHFVETPPMMSRASRTRATQEALPPPLQSIPRRQRRFHWLFFVGLVLMVMLLGYVGLNAFGAWWQTHQDDSTYGRPRTSQIDAVVGHGDSEAHPSHFIAMNLNRHIIIIEIPGGDVSRSVVYTGPILMGDDQSLTPVTLTFADENGDGRPDMVLHILNQTIVFLNNGTKFVPPSTLVTDRGSNPPVLGGEQ